MKKLISLLLVAIMLVSALTVSVSAAASPHEDRAKVLNAAYGTATVDGKLDDAYLKGDKVTSFVLKGYNDYADKVDQVKSSFIAYLMYDENKIYAYAEVTDPTKLEKGATITKYDHNNDTCEFYFWLDDFTQVKEEKLYNQVANPASGMLRIHAPYVCEDELVCREHLMANTGIGLAIGGESIKYEQKRVVTDKGYIVEISLEIPAECKAAVKAGQQIGFAIQVNDNITGENKRDALLWSNNNLGDPQKNGPFLLLAKDAAPATTAPETTKAPETTAAPTTTAPATTPATADASMMLVLVVAAALTLTVALRKRAK